MSFTVSSSKTIMPEKVLMTAKLCFFLFFFLVLLEVNCRNTCT